jgi:hypothetical protein
MFWIPILRPDYCEKTKRNSVTTSLMKIEYLLFHFSDVVFSYFYFNYTAIQNLFFVSVCIYMSEKVMIQIWK